MAEAMNTHLAEAEKLWRASDRVAAVQEYDAAADIARKHFPEKVGEILLGIGFALMQVDETSSAGISALEEARDIAKNTGNQAQVRCWYQTFVRKFRMQYYRLYSVTI